MCSNNLAWTNSKTDKALIVLTALDEMTKDFGLQLMLETQIHLVDESIKDATELGFADDYLYTLKYNLEKTLEDYVGRYNNSET